MSQWVIDWVIIIVTGVLALIVAASYMALLSGLFLSHVDYRVIFQILGPTLNSTVGGFIGILASMKMAERIAPK